MEFRSNKDVQIAEKMSQFPLLVQPSPDFPSVQLAREFDMTQNGASRLAAREPKPGLVPLYEGKRSGSLLTEFPLRNSGLILKSFENSFSGNMKRAQFLWAAIPTV